MCSWDDPGTNDGVKEAVLGLNFFATPSLGAIPSGTNVGISFNLGDDMYLELLDEAAMPVAGLFPGGAGEVDAKGIDDGWNDGVLKLNRFLVSTPGVEVPVDADGAAPPAVVGAPGASANEDADPAAVGAVPLVTAPLL